MNPARMAWTLSAMVLFAAAPSLGLNPPPVPPLAPRGQPGMIPYSPYPEPPVRSSCGWNCTGDGDCWNDCLWCSPDNFCKNPCSNQPCIGDRDCGGDCPLCEKKHHHKFGRCRGPAPKPPLLPPPSPSHPFRPPTDAPGDNEADQDTEYYQEDEYTRDRIGAGVGEVVIQD